MKSTQAQPVHPLFPAVSLWKAATRFRAVLTSLLAWRANTGEEVAEPYKGCAWCDTTEREMSLDVMTGRRPRFRDL